MEYRIDSTRKNFCHDDMRKNTLQICLFVCLFVCLGDLLSLFVKVLACSIHKIKVGPITMGVNAEKQMNSAFCTCLQESCSQQKSSRNGEFDFLSVTDSRIGHLLLKIVDI